ncbi:auxin-responsive protein SAUR36-like [Nymphaea colorata]|uniref:Uncharacterized protein n=1 Tax=Nymphaea colorata TaxID=210225 RepID=A0A5K1H163_9MAGN|nr:auxin-responsive protein SAUR36-like [Nymphaea colorata]
MVLLFEIARKWQWLAKKSRKVEIEDESTLGRYSKGHFAVYAVDGKRYVVPLTYLNHPIFKELLGMAEEEFGLDGHGPLRLPCEGELMDYIVSLLNRNPSQQVEQALVSLTCSSPGVCL